MNPNASYLEDLGRERGELHDYMNQSLQDYLTQMDKTNLKYTTQIEKLSMNFTMKMNQTLTKNEEELLFKQGLQKQMTTFLTDRQQMIRHYYQTKLNKIDLEQAEETAEDLALMVECKTMKDCLSSSSSRLFVLLVSVIITMVVSLLAVSVVFCLSCCHHNTHNRVQCRECDIQEHQLRYMGFKG